MLYCRLLKFQTALLTLSGTHLLAGVLGDDFAFQDKDHYYLDVLVIWNFDFLVVWLQTAVKTVIKVRSSYYAYQNNSNQFKLCLQFSNLLYLCCFWFYSDSTRCNVSFTGNCIKIIPIILHYIHHLLKSVVQDQRNRWIKYWQWSVVWLYLYFPRNTQDIITSGISNLAF